MICSLLEYTITGLINMVELMENIALSLIAIVIMLLVGYIGFSSSKSRIAQGIAALASKGSREDSNNDPDIFEKAAGRVGAKKRELYFKYK